MVVWPMEATTALVAVMASDLTMLLLLSRDDDDWPPTVMGPLDWTFMVIFPIVL